MSKFLDLDVHHLDQVLAAVSDRIATVGELSPEALQACRLHFERLADERPDWVMNGVATYHCQVDFDGKSFATLVRVKGDGISHTSGRDSLRLGPAGSREDSPHADQGAGVRRVDAFGKLRQADSLWPGTTSGLMHDYQEAGHRPSSLSSSGK